MSVDYKRILILLSYFFMTGTYIVLGEWSQPIINYV